MLNKIALFVTVCVFMVIHDSAGQSLKADVSQLSFMKGKWFVDHPWGYMEEYWGEPVGNNMVSSYRCVKDGKVVFYEFVVIEQSDSVPVMILRHFKQGSIAWEDKDDPNRYPLVSISGNKASFRSKDGDVTLTYQLKSKDALDVILEEKNKKGEPERTSFNYKRKLE